MKRPNRNQRLFYILSILLVLSMIGSSLIMIIESIRPPASPAGPSGWGYPSGLVGMMEEGPGLALASLAATLGGMIT